MIRLKTARFLSLFFIIAVVRKWGGEEAGLDFSFLWSLVFGYVAAIVVITIFGSYKFAILAGIIGALGGGYGAGFFGFGDGGEE